MCVCVCKREIERNVNGERVYYCIKTACFSKNACKGVCVCVCVCVCVYMWESASVYERWKEKVLLFSARRHL